MYGSKINNKEWLFTGIAKGAVVDIEKQVNTTGYVIFVTRTINAGITSLNLY